MYLRSKLLLSPTYTLVSQLPSSLQIFTPQFPQLSHAFYKSCLHHPHSFDHAYQSSFLHQNIAFGTFCLIATVAKADNWPINKEMLIKNHYKAFAKFTKQIDKIKEIN